VLDADGLRPLLPCLVGRRIRVVPPLGLVLEPFVEPREDRVPTRRFVFLLVQNEVVLPLDAEVVHFSPEQLEGGIIWSLSPGGTLVSSVPWSSRSGVMILSAEKQRASIDVDVRPVPRKAVGCRHGVVVVPPVPFPPVARYRTDSGVRYGGGENVRPGHDELRHETAEGGADASDAMRIDERMGLEELSRFLDDLIGPTRPQSLT